MQCSLIEVLSRNPMTLVLARFGRSPACLLLGEWKSRALEDFPRTFGRHGLAVSSRVGGRVVECFPTFQLSKLQFA